MKVLIVASNNSGRFSPFIIEQMQSLCQQGVEIETYGIVGKRWLGYLRNVIGIRRKIREFKPNLIHAHYGLSGLCANLQRKVPVVTTFHGSDIHSYALILKLSKLTMKLSDFNLFISKELQELSGWHGSNIAIIPCGIDLGTIYSIEREKAKRQLNREKPFVLFSSSFNNKVKNPLLAKEAMAKVPEAELVELSGYSRSEVNLIMNAANCLLMTSFHEGSPQVIKEAMACGTPIVTVDVGDVKDVIGDTEGCYIADSNAEDIADKVRKALAFNGKTNGRQHIINLGLSNEMVAKRLVEIYEEVMKR